VNHWANTAVQAIGARCSRLPWRLAHTCLVKNERLCECQLEVRVADASMREKVSAQSLLAPPKQNTFGRRDSPSDVATHSENFAGVYSFHFALALVFLPCCHSCSHCCRLRTPAFALHGDIVHIIRKWLCSLGCALVELAQHSFVEDMLLRLPIVPFRTPPLPFDQEFALASRCHAHVQHSVHFIYVLQG